MVAANTWVESWTAAATGPSGFYRTQSPYAHFTTSVLDGSLAHSLQPVLEQALRDCGQITVVDVGAGDGDLLMQLGAALPSAERNRVRWIALDLQARPSQLPDHIEWLPGQVQGNLGALTPADGLLIAHEFLDDVPCPLVEVDESGVPHLVVCDPRTGQPIPGRPLSTRRDAALLDWLERWWPMTRPLMRGEIGTTRDELWTELTAWIRIGYAIAVDYAHLKEDRLRGAWDGGTLTGYREGQVVTPAADGRVNLTAHVALDSVAAAASGNPLTQLRRSGPTPDFWRLVQAYGGLPLPA